MKVFHLKFNKEADGVGIFVDEPTGNESNDSKNRKQNDQMLLITEAWICPVTLLVLGRYPKQINIYIKNESLPQV